MVSHNFSCLRFVSDDVRHVNNARKRGGWEKIISRWYLGYWVVVSNIYIYIFIFTPTWANDPIWLIFVKSVETTNWDNMLPNGCCRVGIGTLHSPNLVLLRGWGRLVPGCPFGIPPLPQTLLRTSCMMCSNSAIHKTRSQEAWCASRYFGPLPRLKWEYRGRLNCEDQSVPCLRDPYVSGRYPTWGWLVHQKYHRIHHWITSIYFQRW